VRPACYIWLNVIDLQSVLALTSRTVRRNEGALTFISHEDFIPNLIGNMSR